MTPDSTVYLDYNATAPARPGVIDAMAETLALGAINPSSVHGMGRQAKKRVERARAQVAALAGAEADQVVFTNGGSEADNQVINGSGAKRVLVSAVEHAAVLKTALMRAADCQVIGVSGDGIVDLAALEAALAADDEPALVSVMTANNETGVLQPIRDVVRIARGHGALVHTDAVQAAGKIELDFASLGVDFMTLSAHKIGGPQGIGAVICKDRAALRPLVLGGGQEFGRRAGTENVAGINGFGVAAELARLPNTTCLTMPGVRNDTQVMALDLAGFAVSAGSACAAGKVEPSHVLDAMDVDEADATQAIRVSLGHGTTETEIDAFCDAWLALWARKAAGRDAA
jgi:cysteine desulfurase